MKALCSDLANAEPGLADFGLWGYHVLLLDGKICMKSYFSSTSGHLSLHIHVFIDNASQNLRMEKTSDDIHCDDTQNIERLKKCCQLLSVLKDLKKSQTFNECTQSLKRAKSKKTIHVFKLRDHRKTNMRPKETTFFIWGGGQRAISFLFLNCSSPK
jgi:hypothetical protein